MNKFVLKFLLLFIVIISVAFFCLIYFQKAQMLPNDIQYAHNVGGFNRYEIPVNDVKEPPIAVPFLLIVSISSLCVYFFLKYINKNFVEPLNVIQDTLQTVKNGKLDVKFDISSENQDIIETYNTMNEMIDGLKQREKLYDNFIQTLTHDLRAPMIAQERAIAILQDELKGHELLEGMMQNTESYLKMINVVMEACTNREIGIDKMSINLSNLVETLFSALKPMAIQKNIQLENAISSSVNVFADYISLNRIITNLVSNSIENIPDGRKITLSAKNYKDKSVIVVRDNGNGISKDELKTIFEKYTSKNKTGKKIVSGLGLYIVHELVRKNNGTIRIESEENLYTRFIIEFPKG